MRIKVRLHLTLAVAILVYSLHLEAAPSNQVDPCVAPYGMTPAALAAWKESIIDASKASAYMREICRMKVRQTSRKPLYELGFNDETIDHSSPLSLMYQTMGASRLAAHLTTEPSGLKHASTQKGNSKIRLGDIEISNQNYERAIYNLKFNGQVASNLLMLGRLGVQYSDSYGRARDFSEMATDTAVALQRSVENGRMTIQDAIYAAQEAGFYGSVATAIATNDPSLASTIKEVNSNH